MMAEPLLPPFDPDFASNAEWAAMYRACGMQVVPARYPMRTKDDKRPGLSEWREFQEKLVPEGVFRGWFPAGCHPQMGVLTGRCSRNAVVVDLDVQTNPEARFWWQAVLEVNTSGIEPETWKQTTGGGGRQIMFEAPEGWHAPTNKTPIGVDIRGQGGFAMLPPSRHMSGGAYDWDNGFAPWEVELAAAPDWLLQAIDDLVEQHGGDQRAKGGTEYVKHDGPDFDAFAARVDGREDAMRSWVWRGLLEMHIANQGVLPEDLGAAQLDDLCDAWCRNTRTRLNGVENLAGLERECRGPTAMRAKWQKALRKWDTQIAKDAADLAKRKAEQPNSGASDPPPRPDPERERVDPENGEKLPLIQTAAQFVKGFRPPEYLIDGMMQRGYVYSLTARTGHGKTAVGMFIGQAVARGLPVAGRAVEKGGVLFLAGENPDDVRARFLVLASAHEFDPEDVPFYFIAGVIDIAEMLPTIREQAALIPDLRLVIVDTAAAYFKGDDGNSNAQQGAYARLLRELSFLPGKPAVLIPSHPVKNASKDNLLPVGGGAFLNEVDGNLTLWADADKHTTLHWQGKFRGPEFEPTSFKMTTVTSERVVDANGVLMPSVVALPITEAEATAAESREMTVTIRMLYAINDHRNAPISQLASACRLLDDNGNAQKSKAFRILQKLVSDKLAEVVLGKYRLTPKGRKEIGIEE